MLKITFNLYKKLLNLNVEHEMSILSIYLSKKIVVIPWGLFFMPLTECSFPKD